MEESNLHILFQERLSLTDALTQLKERFGCERLTVQSGGTVNGLFLREKLLDFVDVVVAPVLIAGARRRAVYLPAGSWRNVDTGEVYAGGETVGVDAPLDRIPVFERV